MTPQANGLLALLPLFPLIGAMINGFFGARIQKSMGKAPIHFVAIGASALSALVAWWLFFTLLGLPAEERALSWVGWDWIVIGFVDARFAFWFDPLTSLMLLIITTIGTLIHIYSVGYMADEPAYWRFFCYLNLFVTMMLILVLGDSFLLMFVGWEGVGLASYLLIGFYYKDLANAAAGMKAFIVNRFGDACFVVGLFFLFWGMQGGWALPSGDSGRSMSAEAPMWAPLMPEYLPDADSVEAEEALGVFYPTPEITKVEAPKATLSFPKLAKIFEDPLRREQISSRTVMGIPLLFVVCVLFFLGATAKSAQIPFYVWLPDAMAGPTPVSALIHAATMVTAGVYMIARLNFIYILSPGACTFVGLVGAATALFAATMGLFQYDIKKVLAYSTVSQLGFMFVGVGTGAYWAGVFHLLTHACFKACLFLGSGSVILGCHHEQDMRRMGGLKKYMPRTFRSYQWACLAIAGFPVFAGFCSKDEILWKAVSSGAVLPGANFAIYGMALIAAGFTAFYMYRSYYMTFTGEYRGNDTPIPDPYPEDTARGLDLFNPKPTPGPSDELLASLAAHGHDDHGHDDHGHDDHHDDHDHHGSGTPHESPASMTIPLLILGGASLVIGVIVGLPPFIAHLVHAPTLLLEWLSPVMAQSDAVMAGYVAANPTIEHMSHNVALEWGLAGLSVGIAVTGWFLAKVLYKDGKNDLPELLMTKPAQALQRLPLGSLVPAEAVTNLHRLIYNKYFVDEVYYTILVRGGRYFWNFCGQFDKWVIDGLVRSVGFAGKWLGFIQGAVDKFLIDGLVHLVARVVYRAGEKIRTLQTGQIRGYMMGAFGGAVAAFVLLIALT